MIMEDQNGTAFSPTEIIHASHPLAAGTPAEYHYALDCEGWIRRRYAGTGNASWSRPLKTRAMSRDKLLVLIRSWGGEEVP
jgi:hypothetical protein